MPLTRSAPATITVNARAENARRSSFIPRAWVGTNPIHNAVVDNRPAPWNSTTSKIEDPDHRAIALRGPECHDDDGACQMKRRMFELDSTRTNRLNPDHRPVVTDES